ncbi:fimbria/pilus outer membrane usher protein [Alcanivorax sediminis]|uniref:Fimbria/pilus outer membrane usher protein n=1 Tax=Alcanivorax sediminis TaxID=2663008 RepID=A0A6N7LZH1_9GAMM|nr:fimbria/pilus outer membrane usher protein [Alcanivorax sediminis]MQX54574.1 fimbria/pilus outer membrane usher protein [Alcanivorax sediminis]
MKAKLLQERLCAGRRSGSVLSTPFLFASLYLFTPLAWGSDEASPRIAAADIAASRVVSLDNTFTQSDIAKLRAQARGQATAAYIAYPQLILNGQATPRMLPVQVYGEEVAVDTRALAAQGIDIPGSSDEQWQTLNQLGIAGHYDNNSQQINLLVPAEWLPHQTLNAGYFPGNSPVQRGQGALLNYDAYSTWLDNGGESTSASHELRLFDDWGIASTSGLVRWNHELEDSGDYVRLDSYWRYTNPQRMQTWMVGDTINGALTWMPSVRLAGVQLSRNFSSRPDLITFPLPQISGSATLPSALEVFVNNLRLADQPIQPGPFVLETSPRVTGLGEVQVVTTDTLGRQVTQTVPFYVSPKLLREGLWDYSGTLGTARRYYGQRSNDYDGKPIGTGVARYGYNERLTFEGTSSLSAELLNAGAGVVFRPGMFGVSNLALAHGQDDDDSGTQWVLGHEFRTRRFGVSGQLTQRTEGYRDLSNSLDVLPNIKSSLQLNANLNLAEQGDISASYLETRLFDGDNSRFFVLGHSRTLWKQLSVTLSVNQNLDDSDDRTWLAGFLYRLRSTGRQPIQAGARFDHYEKDNETDTLLTLRQQVDEFWDLGWDLAYSPDSDGTRQARGRWWTPYVDLEAGVYGQGNELNSFASLNGAFVTNYDDVFASNSMYNSFAIVDTGGFADLPVRRANRVIGHTNSKGRLLMPDLVPWQDNTLSIDVDNLPMDAQLQAPELILKPSELTGVTALFDIQQTHSAILVAIDATGDPIPAGGRVLLPGAEATVVGFDGEIFLQGLSAGNNEIGIISGGSLCTLTFDFIPEPGTLQRLGPATCLAPSERLDPPAAIEPAPQPVEEESQPEAPPVEPAQPVAAIAASAPADPETPNSASLVIQDSAGKPISAGARVLIPNASPTTVGSEGQTLLRGLKEGENEIGIISRAGLCTVKFTFTASANDTQQLGTHTCLSPSEQE